MILQRRTPLQHEECYQGETVLLLMQLDRPFRSRFSSTPWTCNQVQSCIPFPLLAQNSGRFPRCSTIPSSSNCLTPSVLISLRTTNRIIIPYCNPFALRLRHLCLYQLYRFFKFNTPMQIESMKCTPLNRQLRMCFKRQMRAPKFDHTMRTTQSMRELIPLQVPLQTRNWPGFNNYVKVWSRHHWFCLNCNKKQSLCASWRTPPVPTAHQNTPFSSSTHQWMSVKTIPFHPCIGR